MYGKIISKQIWGRLFIKDLTSVISGGRGGARRYNRQTPGIKTIKKRIEKPRTVRDRLFIKEITGVISRGEGGARGDTTDRPPA